MIEFYDLDGYKVALIPEKVDCVRVEDGRFTVLYLTGGNRVYVDEEYERVKRMLDDALVAEV